MCVLECNCFPVRGLCGDRFLIEWSLNQKNARGDFFFISKKSGKICYNTLILNPFSYVQNIRKLEPVHIMFTHFYSRV